ncbi:hypothetical protein RQP46_008161 [Phenoliferia psychrophenolica]
MSIQYSHPFSIQPPPNVALPPLRGANDPSRTEEGLEHAPLPESSSPELLRRLDEAEEAMDEYNLASSVSVDLVELSQGLTGSFVLGADALPRVERLLARISALLAVPVEFSVEADELDSSMVLDMDRFLLHSPALLTLALSVVLLIPLPPPTTRKPTQETLQSRASLVISFGRFTQVELCPFCAPTSAPVARQITTRLFDVSNRHALISYILGKSFPPLFKPHPKLNPATGRVLSKPKGGDNGLIDWYEESETLGWRNEAGMASVVRVVVEALKPNEVEDIWPLVLPPVLSFLDDYQPRNKLLGTMILSSLLPLVSASLLKRTGVGEVFTQSLASSLSSLSSPHTPPLLSHSTAVSLTLLELLHPSLPLTPQTSLARFNALSTLLVHSTITPWSFHSGHIPLELSIATSLPLLITALGTGTIRFLQILVPHLAGLVGDSPVGEGTWELLEKSCVALEETLKVANGVGRAGRWKGLVGAAVGRCWVKVGETERGRERVALEESLKRALVAMGDSGEVMQRLVKVDGGLEGLRAAVSVQ